MTIPDVLVVVCFTALMLLGAFLLIYSVIRLARRSTASELSLPGIKLTLKGPAWLISAFIGGVMIASPLIAAELSKPEAVTVPPPSVQHVRTIPDPSYKAFRFHRDVSLLDLRSVRQAPWYSHLPGFSLREPKPRIHPGVLRNYMLVTKVEPSDKIHLVYGTSGRLDVRCLTHQAQYQRAERQEGNHTTETWDVIADVSAVPVGGEFEIAVEATYWNGFAGERGDDYTTYAHEQVESEQLSVILLFPDDKPFKGPITVTEYPPDSNEGRPLQSPAVSLAGSENRNFYWNTVSARSNYYYKLSWHW